MLAELPYLRCFTASPFTTLFYNTEKLERKPITNKSSLKKKNSMVQPSIKNNVTEVHGQTLRNIQYIKD